MKLEFPILHEAHCVNLTMCSAVEKPTATCMRLLDGRDEREWICRHRSNGDTVFWRLFVSRRKKGLHLHLDFSDSYFFHQGKPKPTSTFSKMQKLVSSCFGNQINCYAEGTFWLRKNEAPPLMITSLVSATLGKLTVKMNRAGMRIEGGSISRAEWDDYDEFLSVKIGANFLTNFDAIAAQECLKRLTNGLGSLSPGKAAI